MERRASSGRFRTCLLESQSPLIRTNDISQGSALKGNVGFSGALYFGEISHSLEIRPTFTTENSSVV
jgi:hypothetical protein